MHFLPFLWLFTLALSGRSLPGQLLVCRRFRENNQKWVDTFRGIPKYDEPVFWGLRDQHLFYEVTTEGWVAGVAMSPKSYLPFVKDQATKMCSRTKKNLSAFSTNTAYELLLHGIGTNSRSKFNLEAFYAKRHGRILSIGSMGDWWAGLYRGQTRIESLERIDSGDERPRNWAFSRIWHVESDDLLVLTRGGYGQENDDIVSIAVETGAEYVVPLQQMRSNLEPSLWQDTNQYRRKNILVMIRMAGAGEMIPTTDL